MEFDPQAQRYAIVAGRGSLPFELFEGLSKSTGQPPFLVGVENNHEDWILRHEHVVLGWGKFGELFRQLRNHGVSHILLAGSVVRPSLEIRKMDWGAIRTLPQILAFMIGGDNSLLTGVIKVFEQRGIQVVGAHQALPSLLAGQGSLAGQKPSRKAMQNLKKAYEACKAIGALDIGQAAVAVGGRVVAVEGIEGTDGMLERVAQMRYSGRLYEDGRDGVLMKTLKPDQDTRVDMPAIGPGTVELAAAAGLRGIAVEAGVSLLLEREKTLQTAKDNSVFIYGVDVDQ